MPASRRPLALVCLALAAAGAASARAQGLLALTNPSADRQLAVIGPATGTITSLGVPIGGKPISTSGDAIAIDRAGNRFFFVGTPNGESTKIFTISTITGLQTSAQALTNAQNGVLFLDWDPGESVLYGLVSVGAGDRQLCTVNLANGAVSLLGSALAGGGLGTGSAHTLDAAGNRFYFIGTPSGGSERLYAVDTTNGAAVSSPVLSGTTTNVVQLGYDDEVVALMSITGGDRQLGTINPGTGAVTLYGNPIAGESLSTSAATLDAEIDTFFFMGDAASDPPAVYSISTVTGFELDSPDLSATALNFLALVHDSGPLFADGFQSGTAPWSNKFP